MSIAAVPKYLGQQFKDASPGMRFGMYLAIWRPEAGWEKEKNPDWNTICKVSGEKRLISALLERQQALAATADSMELFAAISTAPFTTGLGNEHPLENGFSFLWPYGIPYLPGSGVKGVLRQAARELAEGSWGNARGWDEEQTWSVNGDSIALGLIDLLFGLESREGKKDHFRGVLTFWDVIPEIKGDKLMVEIMTPHQTHYYQNGEPPHDSGQPTPISFLTVPPGSQFTFHVVCDTIRLRRIASDLLEETDGKPRWKVLLEAAFAHAFDWLGFGAKTAVGYGTMATDPEAGKSPLEKKADQWIKERVAYVKNANNIRSDAEAYASKPLAEAWGALDDLELKNAVHEALKKKWGETGRQPSKKAAKLYEES